MAWRDEREANLLDGGAPFYAVYECADGRFVAVGALEPPFWAELVAGLGVEVEGEQYDTDTWPAQRAAFTAAFRTPLARRVGRRTSRAPTRAWPRCCR